MVVIRRGKIVSESPFVKKNEAVRRARILARKAGVSYWVQSGMEFDKGN
jgi:hypothetical protein